MAKMKISDDPEIARQQMARELANNSIVNKALARYIEQILEAVNEDTIQPLRDEIDRLRSALSVPLPEVEGGDKGDGWQPMETAPKNWTDVLLFDPEYRNDHRKVFEGYFEAEMEIWCDAGCEPVSPTHWRPLPAAPSASIEGETL